MLEILNSNEELGILQDIKANKQVQIIELGKKIKLEKNITNVIVVIKAELINSRKVLRRIINQLLNLQRKCLKKNIEIGYNIHDRKINMVILNQENIGINNKNFDELKVTNALSELKTEKDKIEYLYDKACEYLDNECRRLNYCDFKDDVCIAKRNPCRGEEVKMGCCYHVKIFSFKKHKRCEFLQDRKCTAQCFACKLFTCDAVKEKYKIKDILYIDCYFNLAQKLILRCSVLTPKEKIISRLLWF